MKVIQQIPFLLWATALAMALTNTPYYGWLLFIGLLIAAGVSSFKGEPR